MILIAGASFTATQEHPTWHDNLINPKHKKINLATIGAGNIYIGESVKTMLVNKIRAVLIMWCEMDNLDIAGSKSITEYFSPLGGKIWNHYGNMVSGKGKSDWKQLGYDKVVEMNIDSITSTLKALDQSGIPYAYSFSHDDENIPEDIKRNAIKPFLGNYAVEKKMVKEDNYHANVDAHRQWSNMIKSQITFMDVIS